MRIAVDLQGAQTGSRFRGIGRYVTALVKALVEEGRDHEFILLLNGAFSESIEPIRADFEGLLPAENIVVWYPVGEPEAFDQRTQNVRVASQIIREYALKAVDPDVILVSSVFEGLGNPAVITANQYLRDTPTASIFYDFTPLVIPDKEYKSNLFYRAWYRHRVEQLKRSDLIFTISDSSRRELHHFLDFPEDRSVNIFGGRSEEFEVRQYSPSDRAEKLARAGIRRPFLLFAGGLEPNKNLRGLIESLSLLPAKIRETHELVIVGRRNAGEEEQIRAWARDGSSQRMLNVVGYVSEDELIDLYNFCSLFVCPSLREGFGLPVAEAMACGAPVVISNRSSLPELIANPAAQFDPESPAEIAATIAKVLTDDKLSTELVDYGRSRAKDLTWANSARTLLDSLEQRIKPRPSYDLARRTNVVRTGQFVESPPRILVMKLDHNGDFLLSVPALMKLRARYPNSEIDIVVGSWNRDAARAVNIFANVYTLDYFKAKSSERADVQAVELDELLSQLPYYDFAIDLRRQSESRFLLVQVPASQYYGYDTGENHIDGLLTRSLPRFPEPGGHFTHFDSQHTVDQILKIVDLLPHAVTDYLGLPATSSDRTPAPGTVAIFPRVGNDARQWDSDRFGELIDRLTANESTVEINLYGGTLAELDSIPFRQHSKIKLHAGYAFPDLLESLAANKVCVGNNSFGVHLGSYAGCTTIGIYSGHERPEQWGPPFGNAWVITADAPCSPCHLPDRPSCPFDLFCLRDIAVDTVERVIMAALNGEGIQEDHAKITPHNPASAIPPLMRTLATARYAGDIRRLDDAQKTALAGAISITFPEKLSARPTAFVDVSGLGSRESNVPARTADRLDALKALAANLGRDREVVWVGSGQHDHEFYAVDDQDLLDLERVLLRADRQNRVVRPAAGDLYLAPDVTLHRNPAQWNLIDTWRQNGVRVVMAAPSIATAGADGEPEAGMPEYLFKVAHFDAIIVDPKEGSSVRAWLDRYGPPRMRKLQFIDGGRMSLLANDRDFIDAVVRPAAFKGGRAASSIREVA